MLRGIDVSRYQKFDDYARLNLSRLAFVFIKASEGIYVDQSFATHNLGFSKTCLLKGAYHFHRFKTKAKAQAEVFINTVRPLFTSLDLPPVLDVEDPTEQLTPGQCEEEIQIWLDRVEDAFQVKPVIYTGRWYWADPSRLNNSVKFKDYPLWHSKYSPQYPPLYGGWEAPLFWQYSQNGSVQGLLGTNVAIDLNYFLGDIGALWNNTSQGLIEPSAQYNPKVEALQYILNLNGFDAGRQDGKFGARTLRALHAWQQETPGQDSVSAKMWQELFGLEVVPPQ